MQIGRDYLKNIEIKINIFLNKLSYFVWNNKDYF